ncbi:MAG: OmpA family protein [Mariprofundus sp.]|nr:OmpA family protein [Mariprofundus sp.]
MMKRIVIAAAATLSLAACAPHMNMDSSALDSARKAVADSKAAGAEICAPKLQAEAVASLYWAAHEITEKDVHPDENSDLIASAEEKAKEAIEACKPKVQAIAAKPAPVVVQIPKVLRLEGVYFDNNSSDLKNSSTTTLNEAAATLRQNPAIRVEVAAHTDSRGSAAYNLQLSESRAASVKDYLINHDIDASRLSSKGYGETDPIASNETSEGRATNRRVELRILN